MEETAYVYTLLDSLLFVTIGTICFVCFILKNRKKPICALYTPVQHNPTPTKTENWSSPFPAACPSQQMCSQLYSYQRQMPTATDVR